MRDKPLPQALQRFSHLADLTFRGSHEWSSVCPHCGGGGKRHDKSDRFRLFDASGGHNARVWCRRCGHFEWADANEETGPDPEAIARAEQLRKEYAAKEDRRIRSKIETLQEAAYWRGWHDAMGQQHRRLWHDQGIIDWQIDYYKLGYCDDYTYQHGGDLLHSPSMTIPHYGDNWQLINIQHRLMKPVIGAGKYRQMGGLPAAMFRTEPDEALTGAVMVVEGAKKAMVCHLHLAPRPLGFPMLFVGVPSKTPGQDMLDQLRDCEPVYVVLDPDAYWTERGTPAVNRLVKMLGRERCYVVKLPVKPDDMLVEFGASADDMTAFIKQAARA